jgi:hypothetical protein
MQDSRHFDSDGNYNNKELQNRIQDTVFLKPSGNIPPPNLGGKIGPYQSIILQIGLNIQIWH